jgi:hypothetical protein
VNVGHLEVTQGTDFPRPLHDQASTHPESALLPTIQTVDPVRGFIGRYAVPFHRDDVKRDLGTKGTGKAETEKKPPHGVLIG